MDSSTNFKHGFLRAGVAVISWCAALAFSNTTSGAPPTCLVADAQGINGVYRMANGALLSVLPSGAEGQRRITHFDSGKSHKLLPLRDLRFQSSAEWESESPAAFGYQFTLGRDGSADTVTIQALGSQTHGAQGGNSNLSAKRVKLHEEIVTFKSGEVELFGKLTLPSSNLKRPLKTVIFVHGSDPVASVDQEWLPHLLAVNGIATFVFDKRGTGCSKGQYVQHFDVLANDVVAAVNRLKTRQDIDKTAIGLAGFSQGGWVAPLAALKDPSIKFVVVGYGLTMSIADEDRLEAPLKLKALGVDDVSIAEYQELNAALHKVAREKFANWHEFDAAMEKFKDRPWLVTAKSMQTWIGVMLQMGVPQAKHAAPQMFEHFFMPFYEPVPTLEKLRAPMLWLIAGQDIEAPPERTIETLKRLRGSGKPFSTVVFPNADHGMQEFELRDGKRIRTRYAKGYFATLLKWVKSQK